MANINDAVPIEIGMIQAAIDKDPSLANRRDWKPQYESNVMGNAALEEMKRLGWKIIDRWNQELYGIVCTQAAKDDPNRTAILNALKLNDAAVIAAVAGVLVALNVPAVLTAALAPFIVNHFIWPAKKVLCEAWGEAIKERATQGV